MPVRKTAQGHGFALEGFNDGGEQAAVIGGRPGVGAFYDNPTQSDLGLPPKRVREGQVPRQEQPAGVLLPNMSVSRQVVGHEILRLRGVEVAIERELAVPPIGASGSPVPYLVERQRESRGELERVREEIERLNNLDDNQLRLKAFELGAR